MKARADKDLFVNNLVKAMIDEMRVDLFRCTTCELILTEQQAKNV